MKIHKEFVILVLIIAVLSLYLVFNKRDRSLYEIPEIEPIQPSKISKITLSSSQETILFIRKNDSWVINAEAWPADENIVQQLADIAADLTLTALVSESENYERYELDPDQRIRVKAWIEDALVRGFDVGKTAPGRQHTFIKLAGDHRIFHAKGNFQSLTQATIDTFRHRIVMSFEPDEIERIRVSKADQTDIYVKQDSLKTSSEAASAERAAEKDAVKPVWKNSAGDVLKKNELTKLIKAMSSLKCQAFVYERQKADFRNPLATVTFQGEEAHTLQIFEPLEKEDAKYPAVSSQSEYPFFLPYWHANQVINALDDIKPVEKPEK